MDYLIIALISLLASAAGAICGIGGGVIIKPVLDSLGILSVSAVSFLSGVTVFCMAAYTTTITFIARESKIRMATGLPLSLGAVIGGLVGKSVFGAVRAASANPSHVGAVQAACLFLLVAGTIVYTLNKSRIRTQQITTVWIIILAGTGLGFFSSFLGIGGGPFNLIVLSFLFSMQTKEAAQNSLFVILFSQASSILQTLVTGSTPALHWPLFILMVAMGFLGGLIGRKVNRRIDTAAVDKLFFGINVLILGICVYNFFRFIRS